MSTTSSLFPCSTPSPRTSCFPSPTTKLSTGKTPFFTKCPVICGSNSPICVCSTPISALIQARNCSSWARNSLSVTNGANLAALTGTCFSTTPIAGSSASSAISTAFTPAKPPSTRSSLIGTVSNGSTPTTPITAFFPSFAAAKNPKTSSLPLSTLRPSRSEEHTSELQSPYDLVCRLLLEKKKKQITQEGSYKDAANLVSCFSDRHSIDKYVSKSASIQ